MLGAVIVIFVIIGVGLLFINSLKSKYPYIDAGLLRNLLFYHIFFALVYYLYATFNPSDSKHYFNSVTVNFGRMSWTDFYGTSTTFIKFLAYPFINYLNFSYEAIMLLFAFLGYLGFVYIYIFFKENIKFRHDFFGIDLLTLLIFLPNLHFWSASLGKGSVIFLGIGMFFFALSKVRSRLIHILIGGFIIYHVRPHILLVILIASSIGFMFSNKGIGFATKVIFLLGASVAFFYIYQDVLTMVGIDEEELITQGFDLTHRATELTKATSGIDITSYSLPEQLFAFLYRPLFFDAPGMLGLIVSFENVFYLIISLKILRFKGLQFLASGNFLVKSAFVSFLMVSIALAQVSGNLGLAMRQKSQVMILFLFVVLSFLDKQKLVVYQRSMNQKMRKIKKEEYLATISAKPQI